MNKDINQSESIFNSEIEEAIQYLSEKYGKDKLNKLIDYLNNAIIDINNKDSSNKIEYIYNNALLSLYVIDKLYSQKDYMPKYYYYLEKMNKEKIIVDDKKFVFCHFGINIINKTKDLQIGENFYGLRNKELLDSFSKGYFKTDFTNHIANTKIIEDALKFYICNYYLTFNRRVLEHKKEIFSNDGVPIYNIFKIIKNTIKKIILDISSHPIANIIKFQKHKKIFKKAIYKAIILTCYERERVFEFKKDLENTKKYSKDYFKIKRWIKQQMSSANLDIKIQRNNLKHTLDSIFSGIRFDANYEIYSYLKKNKN